MGFWSYFKGKLIGIGYIFAGAFAMVAGAWLISAFAIGNSAIGQLNFETALCGAGLLIIIIGGLVIAYGQQHLKKIDEN
ncbi:MAG: hypothetical protein NTV88_00675 [Candidatus Micrarchaeota archaeon]|nr:hypothetical protein [Candidatus Micrarchaeota archaeon]